MSYKTIQAAKQSIDKLINQSSCKWYELSGVGFVTGCTGKAIQKSNGFQYCPYCGGRIVS